MAAGLTVLAGTANPDLSGKIAEELGVQLGAVNVQSFPDGELQAELRQSVRRHDVFLVQSTSPPVEKHLLELMLLADACHRGGADRVTAIVPYFGYARQDRRVNRRQSLGGRVVANIMQSAAIQRLLTVDLHAPAIEGFFSIPLEHLTAVPLLADAVRPSVSDGSIVVAPDLGAVRLAERYARALELPLAFIQKRRVSGREVTVRQVVGDVRGRAPLIVDDMLSTGATIEAAVNALAAAGSLAGATVLVSHGLFVGGADHTLLPCKLRNLLTTDSVTQHPRRLPVEVCSLGPLVAEAVRRLHADESLDDLR